MWSEAENYDLALSFQEKAGCDEIWEKICQVSMINVRLRHLHFFFSRIFGLSRGVSEHGRCKVKTCHLSHLPKLLHF